MSHNFEKTVLSQVHQRESARMGTFAGFEMPIQYSGILEEHLQTRRQAGIFDTCHMGEFIISGPAAVADLDRILSCHAASLKEGRCRYGMMCNPQGGVIDDLLVYRLADDRCMLVVNAGNRTIDFAWLQEQISSTTELTDISEKTAKIDVQGPSSRDIVNSILQKNVDDLKYFRFKTNNYRDNEVLISRTGYTGELGFEVYLPPSSAESFWEDCRSNGATAAGLGARDTLRLEMGLPLYGHELTAERNAAESDLTFAIAEDKNFIGSSAVLNENNIHYKLRGLVLEGKRSARQNDAVLQAQNESEIGWITSASYAPSLEQPVAMAYIRKDFLAQSDSRVVIKRGRKLITAAITALPFYKDGTARKN